MQANDSLPDSPKSYKQLLFNTDDALFTKTYKLLIFDIDGTLVIPHTTQLLPGRQEFFRSLSQWQWPPPLWPELKIALATNQGGVGFRHWLEAERPPWFTEKSETEQAKQLAIYPTQTQAKIRLNDLVEKISRLARRRLNGYISFAYQFKSGGWAPIPPGADKDIRWSQHWRKPNPGMLLQAMNDIESKNWQPLIETNVLMIGDRSEDAEAAQAAGCTFAWAKDFFGEVTE